MGGKSKVERLKIKLLNILIFIFLVILLLSTDKIKDVGILLVYISTWILILHIWLGAYYIIKYLEQENSIKNNFLNLVPLICMLTGDYSFID